jgi:hypothetical protein
MSQELPSRRLLQDLTTTAAEIRRQLHGRIEGLELRLNEHRIVIEGRTDSYYVKQLAQHALMKRMPSSTLLHNAIVVS